jgi:hypothetical protein
MRKSYAFSCFMVGDNGTISRENDIEHWTSMNVMKFFHHMSYHYLLKKDYVPWSLVELRLYGRVSGSLDYET